MIRNLRFAAVHLALAAMVLRALLPAGWMPGASAGTPLVVCTMNGPEQIVLGADGKPLKHQPSQDDARGHEMCPFAAASHLASPSAPAEPVLPGYAVLGTPEVASNYDFSGAQRYAPQSPRAPPAFA
jgi:hypothetical protein